MEIIIKELRDQIQRLNADNGKLRQKYERSKSKRKSMSKHQTNINSMNMVINDNISLNIPKSLSKHISSPSSTTIHISQISNI